MSRPAPGTRTRTRLAAGAAALVFSTLGSGCGTAPLPPPVLAPIPPPPTAEMRAGLGTLAVATAGTTESFSVQPALDRQEAVRAGMQSGLDRGARLMEAVPSDVTAYATLASMMLGGVGGVFAGVPGARLEPAVASVEGVADAAAVESRIADEVLKLCRETAVAPVLEGTRELPEDYIFRGEPSTEELQAIAGEGADSVLVIAIQQQALHGPKAADPPLRVEIAVRVEWIDAVVGDTLYAYETVYTSPDQRFLNWAADDSNALREELERAREWIAVEIVDQLFLRPPAPPSTPDPGVGVAGPEVLAAAAP